MRDITYITASAFMDGRKKRISNSETDGQAYFLHGHKIAWKVEGGLMITNCGYSTNTTKERLNGIGQIAGFSIFQKDWAWYIVGRNEDRSEARAWNGEPIFIKL